MQQAQVWYLFHSGFAVKTAKHLLVFDYYKEHPHASGLGEEILSPAVLRQNQVLVFSSHRHYDHYNPAILRWRSYNPAIRYILSDDIAAPPGAQMVRPNCSYEYDDFSVHTLLSTDEGVAFLVKVDGLCLYHAGDLNWWHWNGETESYNQSMADAYKQQIGLLVGERIDLAFIPMDPRLEDKYLWGLDYFMRTVGARYAFPMHFGSDLCSIRQFERDPAADPYREQVIPLSRSGQSFIWEA